MAKQKPAHHRGTYDRDSRRIVAAANADPATRCWRDGLTLAQHPRHKTGRSAFWTAGHIHAGIVGSPLAPEASTCNYRHGGRLGRARQLARTTARRRTGLTW